MSTEKEIEDFIKEIDILIEKVINMKEYTATAILPVKNYLILRICYFLRKYEKLQKENKELKKSKYVYGIDMDFDYIQKQKIREKIKDIKEDKESKYYDKFLEYRDIETTLEILEELLGKED